MAITYRSHDCQHPVDSIDVKRDQIPVIVYIGHLLVYDSLVLSSIEIRSFDKHPGWRIKSISFTPCRVIATQRAEFNPNAGHQVDPEYDFESGTECKVYKFADPGNTTRSN